MFGAAQTVQEQFISIFQKIASKLKKKVSEIWLIMVLVLYF
jgi:hypothetical protein